MSQGTEVFLWIGLLLVTIFILIDIATIPIVTFSNETGECISVDEPFGNHNCDNRPERYHAKIVK